MDANMQIERMTIYRNEKKKITFKITRVRFKNEQGSMKAIIFCTNYSITTFPLQPKMDKHLADELYMKIR